jgi:hypothetical protein
MQIFPLLQLLDPILTPERCKVHLAVFNGTDDPLDVYAAGGFEEWQSWQKKQNFNREYVVSLIQLPRPNKWLFAGAFDSLDSSWVKAEGSRWVEDGSEWYRYQLERRLGSDELAGRLIIDFERSGRQSYVLGDKWAESMQIAEILAVPYSILSAGVLPNGETD